MLITANTLIGISGVCLSHVCERTFARRRCPIAMKLRVFLGTMIVCDVPDSYKM